MSNTRSDIPQSVAEHSAPKGGARAASLKHVLKYTGIFGSVQVLQLLLSVVRGKFTAVLIGTGGMGLSDLYHRAADLVSNASNLGIAFSAVRRLAMLHEAGRHDEAEHYVCVVRSWMLLAAVLGTVVCLACAPWLDRMLTDTPSGTADLHLLAPVVALSIVAAGEMAILKGAQQLRALAVNAVWAAVGTVAFTVPLYALQGLRGIVPAMLANAVWLLLLQLRVSVRLYPWRIGFGRAFVGEGKQLLHLGMAYVVAGVVASGAEMLVRAFLVKTASLAEAGLYAAGLTLTVSYARMVFVAMDSDYFPRLSATIDPTEMNRTVNRQIDALVLIIAPFLIFFSLALHFVVPLLYTSEFLQTVPMVLCAVFYMFFKAIYTPPAYLPLARGHATTYMVMELTYNVAFAALVIAGHRAGGLAGAGVALSVANFVDLLLITTVYRKRYGFRFAAATLRHCLLQFALLLCGVMAAWSTAAWTHWGLGGAALAASCIASGLLLKREGGFKFRLKKS